MFAVELSPYRSYVDPIHDREEYGIRVPMSEDCRGASMCFLRRQLAHVDRRDPVRLSLMPLVDLLRWTTTLSAIVICICVGR